MYLKGPDAQEGEDDGQSGSSAGNVELERPAAKIRKETAETQGKQRQRRTISQGTAERKRSSETELELELELESWEEPETEGRLQAGRTPA